MADVRMRPRFRREVPCDSDAVIASLAELLESPESGVEGRLFGTSALLKLEASQVRFWSPQLQLSVEATDRGRCLVYGIFGPHSTIWSLFLALYVASGFIGTMGALFAYSQWILETAARAIWAVPAAVVLAAATYAVARIGRFLGGEQTRFLYAAVESRLDALGATAGGAENPSVRRATGSADSDLTHASHA